MRIWKRFCNPERTPSSRAASAAASRVLPPLSAIAMLRESSTTTAIMFCCELNAATVIAGCHSSNNNSATNTDCVPHTAHARQLRRVGAASLILRRTSSANPPAAAIINTNKSHAGHGESSTKRPFVKTGLGYLKRNWNMPAETWLKILPAITTLIASQPRASLMRHTVKNVIKPHPKRHRCKRLRVIRIVGPLPRIAQVHVVTDGNDDPALVVAN